MFSNSGFDQSLSLQQNIYVVLIAIDIIFLIAKYWCLLSRPRSLNIFKKERHSFEKTPKELIDKFTNFTELNCFFCSVMRSSYLLLFRSTFVWRLDS